MKTTITYACGHTEEIVIYGKRADREKKIAWLESQLCAECRAREGAAQGAAKGWAALEGSPKQIAWAEDLRAESINAVKKIAARTETEAVHKDRLIKYLGTIASAAWWIENHGCAGSRLIISCAIKHAAEHGIDLTAETVEEPVAEPVEAAETTETDDIMEYLLNPPEPPPMTEEEKEQKEFEDDVSMYVGLSFTIDEWADERMYAFQHDLKARGKDQEYWDKIVAEARKRWEISLE